MNHNTPWNLGADDMQTLEIFVSVFGLAYAIIVGLLIIEAHGRMHELSAALRSELNAISDIYDCLRFFNNDEKENEVSTNDDKKKKEESRKAKNKIHKELVKYVHRLKIYEWKAMKQSRGGILSLSLRPRLKAKGVKEHIKELKNELIVVKKYKRNKKKSEELRREIAFLTYSLEDDFRKYDRIEPFNTPGIDKIISNAQKLDTRNTIYKSVWEKLLEKICDLTSWRTNRLELAEGGLKGYLRLFVFFMSAIIIIGTILLEVATPELHIFMVCATTAGVVGLFIVLWDVDRPFSGIWLIDENIINAALEKLKKAKLKT
jgi:hypothetical protein